ncbi:MAG: undecaprenyl-diphosphate phosphatase [Clostridia bacterium]|nr:undecaprenyl-diphosphate phosphatase [Clostridia bacterium]
MEINLILESLKALLFGVVEGITEWLPISSTGHMILLDEFVRLQMSDAFMEMFNVVIQLGAIMAVVVLYFGTLWPFKRARKGEGITGWLKMDTVNLWIKVVVAILPSAVVGIPLDDWMDAHLHTAPVVAAMLVIYGVAFIAIERRQNTHRRARVQSVELIDMRLALLIGLFQVLSLVPGTSRSGATILGGMLVGCSRAAAAEFSFYMAIPTMAGASLIKLIKFGLSFTAEELLILAIGCVSAFVVSVVAIKTFIGYIKRHSFTAFGWYRIILGALVAVYFLIRY